eukprot:TRINITY_DN348_c0_g1_i14.p1 TRINITY_DN348_c0_g1~~TRINITY_DN348_c0_g1_i14.p1  ORF type:complete len:360 (-),score=27.03 TRINITY_DN348_c0_g1_i14:2593-3672(-)
MFKVQQICLTKSNPTSKDQQLLKVNVLVTILLAWFAKAQELNNTTTQNITSATPIFDDVEVEDMNSTESNSVVEPKQVDSQDIFMIPPPPFIQDNDNDAQNWFASLGKPYPVPLTFQYRETIFGQNCKFPFTYMDKVYVECYKSPNGKEYCLMPNQALYVCADLPPIDPVPMEVEEAYTVTGESCQLPVLHNGTVLLGCLELPATDQQVCYNGNEWEECVSKSKIAQPPPPPTSNTRITVSGEQCTFPFYFNNQEMFECVEMADSKKYCQIDDQWLECAEQGTVDEEIPISSEYSDTSSAGVNSVGNDIYSYYLYDEYMQGYDQEQQEDLLLYSLAFTLISQSHTFYWAYYLVKTLTCI